MNFEDGKEAMDQKIQEIAEQVEAIKGACQVWLTLDDTSAHEAERFSQELARNSHAIQAMAKALRAIENEIF